MSELITTSSAYIINGRRVAVHDEGPRDRERLPVARSPFALQ